MCGERSWCGWYDYDVELELESFPTILRDDVSGFGADGLLPPGDYELALERFEALFVLRSERRHSIFDGWNRHREALLRDGLSSRTLQLLDGSFTTDKKEPGDIDLAVEVPITSAALAASTGQSPILRLLRGPEMKSAFYCDAYPIYRLPSDDPSFENVTIRAIRYWTKWFAQTRDGRTKGRIWARTGGLR